MEFRADVYFIFLFLALAYSLCFILTILRIRGLFRFLPQFKSAKLLYYFLVFQILSRVLSFWSMCIFSEQIQLKNSAVSFILLTCPDSLLISSLLILLWIMITTNIYTRIDSDENSLATSNIPSLYRAAVITLKILIAWIAIEFVLYALLAFGYVQRSKVVIQQCVWSVLTSVVVVGAIVQLQFKYSGMPFKSSHASKQMKRVNFACFCWSVGRLMHTFFFVIREAELDNPEDLSEISDNTVPLVLTVVDLIISELFCYYLVLNSGFFRIFFQPEVHSAAIPLVSRQPRDNYIVELQETTQDDIGLRIHKEIFNQKGKLGVLYQGIFNEESVVIRRIILNRVSSYVIEKLQSEVADLKSIANPYLLMISKVVIKKPNLDIITPYITEGSLFSVLHEKKIALSVKKKLEIAKDIAFSMKLTHDQNRVHGHLSSHNILLNTNSILITDLGLEHLKKYVGLLGGYCNKNAWSSPEVLKESGNVVIKANKADDIYSFGMILWEIISEQEPFPQYNLKKLKELVGDEGYRPAVCNCKVPGVEELIKSCWNIEPAHRPSFHLVFSTLNRLCE